MKTNFIIFFLASFFCGFSQENVRQDSLKTVVFSLTPRTKKVQQINGLTIGLGYDLFPNSTIKKVNGLNLEINPFTILYLMFDDPTRRGFPEESSVKINGLSIATGHSNQNEDVAYSGWSVSLINSGFSCNGISVNGFYNYSTELNGLHISGFGNISRNMNGLSISFSNDSENLNGIQIGLLNNSDCFNGIQMGIFNQSSKYKGIQIGLVNKTKGQKGFQVGFWNINNKRSFPFLNW
ncbi:hypothetical protein [Flavobacterium sp.]|uniref:LA_2272 family surface repeat-containing protein n=1 Tax=Flavobacterium sp. TaxID=239 RepID=UPI002487157B|nr:hypothetical protein [Flavobacterium sp.]MDI1318231.1 hypothetical protein [Flavobacterium sp.]